MDELIFLFANDSDPFNRWDAGQSAAKKIEKEYVRSLTDGLDTPDRMSQCGACTGCAKNAEPPLPESFVTACGNLLKDSEADDSFRALALHLPSEELMAQEYKIIDFDALHTARNNLKHDIGIKLEEAFYELFSSLEDRWNNSAAMRKLALRALSYLAATGKAEYLKLCLDTYFKAGGMTMSIGALAILAESNCAEAGEALNHFYNKWRNERNVIVKWFAVQAASPADGCLDRVLELEKNAAFDIHIPNLVRSLVGSFGQNMVRFNDISGSGYSYMAGRVIGIDSFNPSLSSALANSFKLYGKTDGVRKPIMKKELERILDSKNLSKNTCEIVENILNYG
jgi:aminopeptidase N